MTGIRQTTGNWPGVTVERKQGSLNLESGRVTVVDLPGIYTLDAISLDEQITRQYLLSRDADVVINVLDAANLERNLYLTVQLLEMGVAWKVAPDADLMTEARQVANKLSALPQMSVRAMKRVLNSTAASID